MEYNKTKSKLEANGLNYYTNRYLAKIKSEKKVPVVKKVKEVVVNG